MDEITLSSGVVLRLKPVGPFIIREATRHIVPPRVPVQFIESKGREEENPMHPDYLAAMDKYETDKASANEDAVILFGTELAKVPKGISKPEDDGWIEDFELLGIRIHDNPRLRYVQWVKLYAMRGGIDELISIMRTIGRKSSVLEEDAAEAAESFRGDEVRSTDNKARDKKAN